MDVSTLIRDAQVVKKNLVTLPDKRVITKTGGSIHIPTRFIDRGIATVGVNSSTVGVLAFIDNNQRYSVLKVPSRLNVNPSAVSRTMVNNTDYTVFNFEPGSVVFKSTQCVKEDTLVYYLFDELFIKGKVPWYLDYNDMGRIFSTAKEYAGTSVASNRIAIELINSHIARQKGDKTKFFRHALTTGKTDTRVISALVEYISLNDVSYSPTSTMYKLAGSYMEEGLVSAFNNPSEHMDRIEAIVRA